MGSRFTRSTNALACGAALFVAFAAVLSTAQRAGAATINVSTTAQLQSAVTSAHNGDTIVLAPGTYSPTATLDLQSSITMTGPSTAPGATISGASVQPDANLNTDTLDVDLGLTATIQNLTFTSARADGYAINAPGTVAIQNSTFSANNGSALWLGGTDSVTNSTISANASRGIMLDGNVTLTNDTIASNAAGGIVNPSITSFTRLINTIVWGNTGGDCTAPVDSTTSSLDGDGTCGVGALSRSDPRLGPLAANGGPTQTRALLPGSAAFDQGVSSCPAVDQRYVLRSEPKCDLGAYEYIDHTAPTISTPPSVTAVATTPGGVAVVFTVTYADVDDPVATSGCSPASGSVFPLGTTTVTCTATDTHGNTATASFPVTINSAAAVACRLDGKLSGRGGLLLGRIVPALAAGFRDDVCGKVVDPGGDTMVVYNTDALTGSTYGLAGASCRTDAFFGSDVPYDGATLGALQGAPGALGCSDFAGLQPRYAPTPAPYPDPADVAAPIMTFPVAGTSIALGVNLPASACGGAKPASIQLTTSLASRLLGGDIRTWDDASLRAGGLNAALANCHVNVTRVVRFDSLTTTQVLKNYLVNADDARSTSAGCFLGGHWGVFATPGNDTLWPIGSGCSALANGGSAGPAAQLSKCTSTTGAVCYGDLADVLGQPVLIRPSIRNAIDTAFAPPSTSTRANCSFGTLTLPANTDIGAVGLDAQDTWATDNPSGNHGDATFNGSAYPICELAFALVDTGLRSGNTTARLTYDQRQTLYAFVSYALASEGQDRLGTVNFTSLPPAVATSERRGFQSNY